MICKFYQKKSSKRAFNEMRERLEKEFTFDF